jgi:hypothetical protein
MAETWLKCSACRTDIGFGEVHWVCSVSTCNRNRTRLVFCSVACWDSHVAMLRHRDSWAVEAKAPTAAVWERELAAEAAAAAAAPKPATVAPKQVSAIGSAPVARRVVGDSGSLTNVPPPSAAGSPAAAQPAFAEADRDMLIVVSKLKKYVKDRAGMNCSDAIAEILSDHVRAICDDAIRAAGRDERKTVLERDVPRPPRRG